MAPLFHTVSEELDNAAMGQIAKNWKFSYSPVSPSQLTTAKSSSTLPKLHSLETIYYVLQ